MKVTDRENGRFCNTPREATKTESRKLRPTPAKGEGISPQLPLRRRGVGRVPVRRAALIVLKSSGGGESGIVMSTIEEVRAAEKKVQEVLDALKKAGAQNPNNLSDELKSATDEYARAVRE